MTPVRWEYITLNLIPDTLNLSTKLINGNFSSTPSPLLCVANTCWSNKCKSKNLTIKCKSLTKWATRLFRQNDKRADGVSGSLCAVEGKFHWPWYPIRYELREEHCRTAEAKKASPHTPASMQLIEARNTSWCFWLRLAGNDENHKWKYLPGSTLSFV